MLKKYFFPAVCLLLSLAALPIAVWLSGGMHVDNSAGPKQLTAFQWRSIDGGEESLTTIDRPLTLLFMGYLSCEDVCPTTLGRVFTAARDEQFFELSNFLFITVDPAHDSVATRRLIIDDVAPQVYSGEMDRDDLRRLRRELMDPQAGSERPSSHSGSLYLLDQQYQLLRVYPFETFDASALKRDLQRAWSPVAAI